MAMITETITNGAVELAGDPDRAVSERTRERMLDGVPENTRKAYARQWAAWSEWCARHGRCELPATGETLAEFVTELADGGKAPASIEQAIGAIRTAHRVAGHPGTPNTDRARLVLRGYRRERAEAGQRAQKAPPVTLKALRRMIEVTDPATVIGARDRLLLVLGFSMMARRSELAGLGLADVVETDDGLEVLIKSSKTDKDSVGETVAVPRGQHPDTDPVRLLRAWREVLSTQGITDGKLFRSVTRHGRIGASMSTDGICDAVRAAAVRAGLANAQDYSAHSLRAGGATSAYKSGAPVSTIASHGRWSPTSPVVLGYIRAVDKWSDNPMRGVGL